MGFASTFALVLTGLRAAGATEAEAASGLLVICLTTAPARSMPARSSVWLPRFLVTMASQNITGMTVLSISAPFWGLVAGLGAQQRRERSRV